MPGGHMKRFSAKHSFLVGASIGFLFLVVNTIIWSVSESIQPFLRRVYAPLMVPFDKLWTALVNAGIFNKHDAVAILFLMVVYFILVFGLLGIVFGLIRHVAQNRK